MDHGTDAMEILYGRGKGYLNNFHYLKIDKFRGTLFSSLGRHSKMQNISRTQLMKISLDQLI